MAGLLDGVRVLDLTNVLAGPYCCYQLALLGADVIKIEEPKQGDLSRQLGADPALNRRLMGASFLAQNGGKRSVALNLKHPKGRSAFLRLVKSADAVVENFRPGVMDRLGLGYPALALVRPGLVYCAISGFGQTGPLRDNPAYDQIIQGLSGIMSITGDARSAPLRAGYPVCDTTGGMVGAFAVAAALFRRARTGEGAFLDVSMLESAISALAWAVSNYHIAGVEPAPMGNENVTVSPSGAFATAAGTINIAANKQEHFEALCREIGRPELPADARFAERESRLVNRYALKAEIEKGLAADGAEGWERRLNARGVPAGRVLTVPEILDHPQIAARGMVLNFEAVPGVGRPVRVVRGGFTAKDAEAALRRPPARLGEHTEELLAEAGLAKDEIAALKAEGAV